MPGISGFLGFEFDRLCRVGAVLEYEWIAINDRVIGKPECWGGGGDQDESDHIASGSTCDGGLLLQISFADFPTSRNSREKWGTPSFILRRLNLNLRTGSSLHEYSC